MKSVGLAFTAAICAVASPAVAVTYNFGFVTMYDGYNPAGLVGTGSLTFVEQAEAEASGYLCDCPPWYPNLIYRAQSYSYSYRVGSGPLFSYTVAPNTPETGIVVQDFSTLYDTMTFNFGTLNHTLSFGSGSLDAISDKSLSGANLERLWAAGQSGRFNDILNGGYVGILTSLERVESPVPEPTTWALMISGFGLIGGTMRRASRPTLAQPHG